MKYRDGYYKSHDGLRLHYRDYDQSEQKTDRPSPKPVMLCLPGLTRNARDFWHIAERYSKRFRVLCAEQRGRGLSDYDPKPERYVPATYVGDMFTLLDHLAVHEVHIVATSLGGLMTMMMAKARPGLIKTALINDIGPKLEEEGLALIKSYVGLNPSFSSFAEAVAYVKAMAATTYPDFSAAQWQDFTDRLVVKKSGHYCFDYDPHLAFNFKNDTITAAPNLWPVFDGLNEVPLLVIRGALSRLFSAQTLEEMKKNHPNCQSLTVPNTGHAPILNEPEVLKALDQFYREQGLWP